MPLSTLRRLVLVPPRLLLLTAACALLILVPAFVLLASSFDTPEAHNSLWAPGGVARGGPAGARAALALTPEQQIEELVLHGGVIMPRLGNATVKAEVGRASWKLLHTMAARFPEKPTEGEKEAFKSFIYLFSRLYPCGECAAEFQALLRKHPPQTSSRGAAAMHLCHLHNLVNARLGKEEFDCSANLAGVYDCGCGDDTPVEGGDIGTGKKHAVGRGAARRREEVEEAEEEEEDIRRDPLTGAQLVGG